MTESSRIGAARRPRLQEMDRIDTKSVRHDVKAQDRYTYWRNGSYSIKLNLIWLERTSGTFGPASAAYASLLRTSIKRPVHISEKLRSGRLYDRGSRKAQIMYFECPCCSRRCSVLYSIKSRNKFACVKCNRPAYPSNCSKYTGRRNAKGISPLERQRQKYAQEAERIKKRNQRCRTSTTGPCAQIQRQSNRLTSRQEAMGQRLRLCEQQIMLYSLRIDLYKLQNTSRQTS